MPDPFGPALYSKDIGVAAPQKTQMKKEAIPGDDRKRSEIPQIGRNDESRLNKRADDADSRGQQIAARQLGNCLQGR